jgi:transposase
MLQITPQHRLLLAVEAIDFRAGIDRLKSVCQQYLACDPFSGTIFAFANRARTSVKLLVYDASGFWLCQKRFSQGKLAWWPAGHTKTVTLRASEFLILMAQGNPLNAAIPEDWRPLQNAQAANDTVRARVS